MKKSGMARAKTSHEIVHGQFECFGIFYRDKPLTILPGMLRPTEAVERGIEVMLENCTLGLIEDPGALFHAQLGGS